MGSPLAPKLAELCLDFVFDKIIPKLPFQLPFIFKFMDDTIMAIPNNSEHIILSKFNSFDPRLQFTIESENEERSIPFLDTLVIRSEDGHIDTDWYRKPQNSGRIIHFKSNQPYKHKINTIKNILDRIDRLSSPKFRPKNYELVKEILKKNGYPSNCISGLFARRGSTSVGSRPERPKFYSTPYIKGVSEKLSKILNSSSTKLAFKNRKTIGSLFYKTKDPVPPAQHKNIVYDIQCTCSKRYIGHTQNFLSNRVKTHEKDSSGPIKPNSTALTIHSRETGHKFKFETAKTIGTEPIRFKREILEMIHIERNKDRAVNFRTDVQNLNKCYSGLIHQIQPLP